MLNQDGSQRDTRRDLSQDEKDAWDFEKKRQEANRKRNESLDSSGSEHKSRDPRRKQRGGQPGGHHTVTVTPLFLGNGIGAARIMVEATRPLRMFILVTPGNA